MPKQITRIQEHLSRFCQQATDFVGQKFGRKKHKLKYLADYISSKMCTRTKDGTKVDINKELDPQKMKTIDKWLVGLIDNPSPVEVGNGRFAVS